MSNLKIMPMYPHHNQINNTEVVTIDCLRSEEFARDQLLLITNGFTLTFVAFLGVIGNILSIIVLMQSRMRSSSMNKLLVGLQITDLLLVISMILFMGVPVLVCHYEIADTYRKFYLPFMDVIFYPLSFTEVLSHFYTVLITLERYVAVCLPFRAKSLCSSKRALISSGMATVFSILYGLPLWFERKVEFNQEESRYYVVRTELDRSANYNMYFTAYSTLVILYLLPFIILIVCNTAIYREIRISNKNRGQLRASTNTTLSTTSNSEKNSLSFMLFAIVITFIFCNMFQLISNILRFVFDEENSWFVAWCIDPYRKLFITFNSSVNFLFYCVFAKKFRVELCRLLNCSTLTNTKVNRRDFFKRKGRSSSEKTMLGNAHIESCNCQIKDKFNVKA